MKKERKYPKTVAGNVITKDVPTARPDETIADLEKRFHRDISKYATINYVYILSSDNKLVGIISIKEIFRSPLPRTIKNAMHKEIIAARPHTPLERAAFLAVKAGIKAMPVTDKDGKFLGVITADSLQEILHQESVEDALLTAGFTKTKGLATALLKASPSVHFRKRIPWLLAGLLGGLLAAVVVSFYEHALREELLLASFIPMVVYLADAAGSQTQTLYIRSIIMETKFDMRAYMKREVDVVLRLAIVLALTIGFISFFAWKSAVIGVTLGVSIFFTLLVSTAVAIFLPWFFTKKNIDPAVASGPFATLIRDITNLFIYFTVATLVLRYFA